MCDKICISCEKGQEYKIGFSFYHGICRDHKIDPVSLFKCVHCSAVVPAHCTIKVSLCQNCRSLRRTFKTKKCTHLLCENCVEQGECVICKKKESGSEVPVKVCQNCKNVFLPLSASSIVCESCIDQQKIEFKQKYCNYCGQSDSVSLKPCGHLICPGCEADECKLCCVLKSVKEDNKKCQYCCTNPATLVRKCSHWVCANCSSDPCLLCGVLSYKSQIIQDKSNISKDEDSLGDIEKPLSNGDGTGSNAKNVEEESKDVEKYISVSRRYSSHIPKMPLENLDKDLKKESLVNGVKEHMNKKSKSNSRVPHKNTCNNCFIV